MIQLHILGFNELKGKEEYFGGRNAMLQRNKRDGLGYRSKEENIWGQSGWLAGDAVSRW